MNEIIIKQNSQNNNQFQSNIAELDILENYKLPTIYKTKEHAEILLKKLKDIDEVDVILLENVGGLNWVDGTLMLIILISYLIFS